MSFHCAADLPSGPQRLLLLGAGPGQGVAEEEGWGVELALGCLCWFGNSIQE